MFAVIARNYEISFQYLPGLSNSIFIFDLLQFILTDIKLCWLHPKKIRKKKGFYPKKWAFTPAAAWTFSTLHFPIQVKGHKQKILSAPAKAANNWNSHFQCLSLTCITDVAIKKWDLATLLTVLSNKWIKWNSCQFWRWKGWKLCRSRVIMSPLQQLITMVKVHIYIKQI